MKTISDLGDLRGKRVLVRSDLNVPLEGSTISDDGRVRASVPTIVQLADAGAQVLVVAHLGRPEGRPDPTFSLEPVATRLGELIEPQVYFAKDTVGDDANTQIASLADGDVLVLENVRFNAGETSKDDKERGEFADELAELADVFVSDGFGVVHRKQASVYDVAMRLPAAVGGLVEAEVTVLKRLTEDPERPYTVVLGGSKVSDKLGVIDNLLDKADNLLIGGGMVFTFLAAQGHEVGQSLLEEDQLDIARDYIAQAEAVSSGTPVSYSREQADRGEEKFDDHCAECHGEDLRGGLNGGPPLSGLSFEEKFLNGAPASGLFLFMSTAMPPNSPGRFSPEVYADMMAFILKENGFQPGAELPSDVDALDNLILEK